MSKIQWTKETWNPIAGCTRVSPGCQNCYAEKMAKRLAAMGQVKYQGTIDKNGRWSGQLNRADEAGFNEPLRNKKSTTYFVNSMSDLFHESVPSHWLTDIWNIMRDTPQHTYQILTKRADVMEERVSWLAGHYGILPNVWLGVSVENQEYADRRIPYLLNTPAAVRFLSCEPLLGPVRFADAWLYDYVTDRRDNCFIDWVIIGGESGPGARPFCLDWARDLIKQCQAANVPVFMKQLGSNQVATAEELARYPLTAFWGRLTRDKKGGDMSEPTFPEDLRIREMPPLRVTA